MAVLSADARIVALCDGWVRVWDVASAKELPTPKKWGVDPLLVDRVRNDAFSSNDPAKRQEARRKSEQLYKEAVWGMPALSRNGQILAIPGLGMSEVSLLDVKTGKELAKLTGISWPRYGLSFSFDDTMLAVPDKLGEGSLLRLYDVPSGKELRQIADTSNPCLLAPTFSPDGRTLAAWHCSTHFTDGKSVLVLWDVATGKQRSRLIELKSQDLGLVTTSLVFSPDGRMLAGNGPHNTVCLWEVATGRERLRLEGHRGPVLALSFSSDGQRLLSGSQDTSVLIWDLSGPVKDKSGTTVRYSSKELEALWNNLGGDDARQAYQAVVNPTAAPKDTLALLKEHLHPAMEDERTRIAQLVSNLDADDFRVREKAVQELTQLGGRAEPAVRKALEGGPSLEAKRRIQQLLEKLWMSPQGVRDLRALEILEHLDTPEARQLLAKLASGDPGAWLTQEAKAVNRRLAAKQR
jgi:hypothetical protein